MCLLILHGRNDTTIKLLYLTHSWAYFADYAVSSHNIIVTPKVTAIPVLDQNPPDRTLPSMTNINLPLTVLTDLESFECMYVRIPQILYVTENYNLSRYGEFWLSSSGVRLMQPR